MRDLPAYRGGVPFGYRLVDGELAPVEAQQAAIAAEMVEMHARGLSLRAIRDAMQAKGHKISHEGVARILKARRSG